jgi:hypothetical protein
MSGIFGEKEIKKFGSFTSFKIDTSSQSFTKCIEDHQKRLVQAGMDELLGTSSRDSQNQSGDAKSGSENSESNRVKSEESDLEDIRKGLEQDLFNLKNGNQKASQPPPAYTQGNTLPTSSTQLGTYDISFLREYQQNFTPGCNICQVKDFLVCFYVVVYCCFLSCCRN